MPHWDPCVNLEQQVRPDFKVFSEWMGYEQPVLKTQHSLTEYMKMPGNEPDAFAAFDQSATTCSVQSPNINEETKEGHAVILASRMQVAPARHVPIIRNPGKIAKPPKKTVKKEVESKVQSRKAQKHPPRKDKTASDQIDFTQKQERSVVPSKSEVKTIAETEDLPTNKYYMNFDFYFKRTSFRTMTLYFKIVFKPYFEAWKSER